MNRPFLWGWLAVALVALAVIVARRNSRARRAMLFVFGLATAMFLAEGAAAAYGISQRADRMTGHSSPQWVSAPDSELGHRLNPGARVVASRAMGNATLYRVTYTITDAGARTTRGNARGDTWLFMGCSFTFGDGVEDDETLPSRFSEQLGFNANVVNLGVSGYGANNVLRQLELRRLAGAAPPVEHVIYQALPAHVARSAGRFLWGMHGPAYRISGDTVRYDGRLRSSDFVRVVRVAHRSDLLRLLMDRLYFQREPTTQEIDLYARTVARAGALAKEALGAGFTVLYWDADSETSELIFERLAATGLPIVRASSLVPLGELDSLRIPYDYHPTPEAYRRVAAGLATHFGITTPNKAR
jgi:hypothetical protein